MPRKVLTKRRRKRHVAVDDSGCAEARVHLDNFHVERFGFEQTFGLRKIKRHS